MKMKEVVTEITDPEFANVPSRGNLDLSFLLKKAQALTYKGDLLIKRLTELENDEHCFTAGMIPADKKPGAIKIGRFPNTSASSVFLTRIMYVVACPQQKQMVEEINSLIRRMKENYTRQQNVELQIRQIRELMKRKMDKIKGSRKPLKSKKK